LTLEAERPALNNSQQITVFISYAREDSKAAIRLRKDLKDAGLNPWLDKEKILPGQNWENQIEDAISKSRYFIPLFSRASVQKIGYVQNEFKFALDVLKRYPPNMIFCIPIRLDDCEIPYRELKSIHHADLFPVDDDTVWKEGVNQILQAIRGVTSVTTVSMIFVAIFYRCFESYSYIFIIVYNQDSLPKSFVFKDDRMMQ
jgi:hypothetical protein